MPEPWRPYWLVDRVTPSGTTGTFSLQIGASEEFEGDAIYFVASAGTLNIERIKDSSGKAYTNADSANPIPGGLFLTALDQRTWVAKFATPLVLAPNTTLTIEFSGATGSANLDCIVVGKIKSL